MLQLCLAIDYVNFTFQVLNVILCKFEDPNWCYVNTRVKKSAPVLAIITYFIRLLSINVGKSV